MRFIHSKYFQSTVRILGTVLAVCLLFVLAERAVYHGMQWYYKAHPEIFMKELPFYQVLEEHDPQLFNKIREDIVHALENNHPPIMLRIKVRSYLNAVLTDKLPYASDESILKYMRVTLKEMMSLKHQGYGLCHRFIYPKPGEMLDITQYVPKEIIEADMAALSEVVRTAYEDPQKKPNPEEVRLYMTEVYGALQAQYGQDLALLDDPLDPYVNKDKICNLNIALFEEIFKLPTEASSKTLRHMIGH